jgi:hypothetical protein
MGVAGGGRGAMSEFLPFFRLLVSLNRLFAERGRRLGSLSRFELRLFAPGQQLPLTLPSLSVVSGRRPRFAIPRRLLVRGANRPALGETGHR